MIKITFPDGAVREYNSGVTALEIARSISEGLARKVLAANVNGQVCDAPDHERCDPDIADLDG
jgi:threonyl-tRNA synthetase